MSWDVTGSTWKRRLRITYINQQTALSTFGEPTAWHQCDPFRRLTYLPSEKHLTLTFQWAPQRNHSKGRTHLNREILLPDQVEQSSCLLDIAISREGIIIPDYPGVLHSNCPPDIAISREGIIIPDYPVVRHSKCLPDIAISREGIIIPDYPVVWPDFLIWAIIVQC